MHSPDDAAKQLYRESNCCLVSVCIIDTINELRIIEVRFKGQPAMGYHGNTLYFGFVSSAVKGDICGFRSVYL